MEFHMTPAASAASASAPLTSSSVLIELFGYQINFGLVMITVLMFGIFMLFWRIQRAEKLDFADMITKDGRTVSLTKVLQLLGGATATWVIIKLTLAGAITESLLGVYLTYVGAIEGYSKYVAAKHGYKEVSVKDATGSDAVDAADPSLKPPKA
jgi:hypothetical protein